MCNTKKMQSSLLVPAKIKQTGKPVYQYEESIRSLEESNI